MSGLGETRGLYYKTIQTRILREMNRFCSKLVSFGRHNTQQLEKNKHTSLQRSLYTTNTYYTHFVVS
jgi:hypothetical protein